MIGRSIFAVARSRAGRVIYASVVALSVGGGLVPQRVDAGVPALVPVVTGVLVRGVQGGQLVTRTLPLTTARGVPAPAWVAMPVIGTLGLMALNGEFLRARPALAPNTSDSEFQDTVSDSSGVCQYDASVHPDSTPTRFASVEDAARFLWHDLHRRLPQYGYAGIAGPNPWGGGLRGFSGSCPEAPPIPSQGDMSACGNRAWSARLTNSELPSECTIYGAIRPVWVPRPQQVCPYPWVLDGNRCVRYRPDGIPTIEPQGGMWGSDPRDGDRPPATVSGDRVTINGTDQYGTPVRVDLVARPDGGLQLVIGVQQGDGTTHWRTVTVTPGGQATESTETRPGTPTQSPTAPPPPPQQELKVETCGLPGKPPCKIDETGTPTASSDPPPQLQAALDQWQQAVGDEYEMPGTPPVLPSLPSGRCSPIQYTLLGRQMSLDLCPYAEISRAVLGWLYAMILGWYVWRRGHDVVIGR